MNLKTIAREYYLPAIESRRCADTADGYRSSIELHVLPRFGEYELHEIEYDDIQDWVDELAPKCGPGGAEKAWKCLRQIFNWACKKWKLRLWNPCTDIELPRKQAYRPEVLTTRRLKKLVRGFVGHENEPTLIISAALGLRPGENYFLSWSDINWRTGLVPIRGTLRYFRGQFWEFPPKTAKSERDCFLPQWALDRLHQLWVEAGRPKGRIIGSMKPYQVTYAIQHHIKKNKLPRITMKNLRHTWGTIAASIGVAIAIVAAMMGHTNVQTTYRYYFNLSQATKKRVQKKVARSVLGKTCDDMYKGIVVKPIFAQVA